MSKTSGLGTTRYDIEIEGIWEGEGLYVYVPNKKAHCLNIELRPDPKARLSLRKNVPRTKSGAITGAEIQQCEVGEEKNQFSRKAI